MLQTVLVFTLLVSSTLSAKLCEERLDVMEERMDSLAREVGSLAATIDEVLQTVREVMLFQTEMSPGRYAGVKEKSITDEEKSEDIPAPDDDFDIDNTDYIPPRLNDTSLEERVAVLEFQMTNVQDEVTNVQEDVTILDVGLADLAEDVETQITIIQADITFIQADQTTQDQRLFDVEEEVETVEADVIELDSRVTALEELNVTVEMLATDIETLYAIVGSLNESIEDFAQRIEALEHVETIGFHAYLGEYTSIPEGTVVVFPNIQENPGNGYDGATGEFTVPAGGAGVYYFYAHFLSAPGGEWVGMWLRHNGDQKCVAFTSDSSGYSNYSCGAVIVLQEGDVIDVYYANGDDDTPLHSNVGRFTSFSGFRITSQ